jgi:hypothetical protein
MTNTLDVPAYRVRDVIRACNVPRRMLKSWAEDRVVAADKTTHGTGDHRKFSLRSVHKIAIAHRLVECGLRPKAAVNVAAVFSDKGTHDRPAGALFSSGKTWLICPGGQGARVVNATAVSLLEEALENPTTGERPCANAIVDCNAVVANVNARLGIRTHRPRRTNFLSGIEFKRTPL